MTDAVEKPADPLLAQVKNALSPPALLLQSAGSGLAEGYADAATCTARFVRASVDQLGHCTREMLAAGNLFGVASCYGSFLVRLGQEGAAQSAEIGRIMVRTGMSVMTAQVDGSCPSALDGAPPFRLHSVV